MTRTHPPRLATWLLKHFGFSRHTQAILGDLTECYRRRQSTLWYWRQVAIAIIGSRWREVRDYLDQGITFFRISGGHIRKAMAFVLAIVVGLSFFLLQAQAQFSVRAASDQQVTGWDRMDYDNHAVWVSPEISLTSADILRAETTKGHDGRTAVSVIFTEAGARKMAQLSTAQLNKLIAMVLDGKVIFAPKVRAEIGAQALITGNASGGLPTELAQRIVESVNKK